MSTIRSRLKTITLSKRNEIVIFFFFLVATGIAIAFPMVDAAKSAVPVLVHTQVLQTTPDGVKFTGALSQTKVIKGQDGIVYLEVGIEPPAGETTKAKTPIDVVVVLDRSGSMSAENRLPYAKAALRELISRLTTEDRFGLVSFETSAAIYSNLTPVTPDARERLGQIISGLTPAGSTNMSAGLDLARTVFQSSPSDRQKKVILLSDGEANLGITDPVGLRELARSFGSKNIILSTIGMGLGFKETLMSSLADYGMGHYSYLEQLASLGNILEKDLSDTRNLYASNSSLELKLGDGIRLIDAGGFPLEVDTANSKGLRIITGQLLTGLRKNFIITLAVPTLAANNFSLGEVELHYNAGAEIRSVALPTANLQLAVVMPEQAKDAVASINKSVFERSWVENNLGRTRLQFADSVRQGDYGNAKKAVDDYQRSLTTAQTQSGIALDEKKVKENFSKMNQELDDAFTGSPSDQSVKQNRLGKKSWTEAQSIQRSY